MSPTFVGALAMLALALLMALRIPIAICFAVVSIFGGLYLGGPNFVLGSFKMDPYTEGSSYMLMTIPLFILMGLFAFHAGITTELYRSCQRWLGHLPGGLAAATIGACAGFAACTGSSVACAAAMGQMALPEMKIYGYDDRLATGTVAMGGTLGILIPPSTPFIVYGMLTETSIGRLFMAGILPGIMIAASLIVFIGFRAILNPDLAPRCPSFSWRERFISLKGTWGMLLLFLVVMGGLWGGIFTATEASAVGCFGAFAICIALRRLTWEKFKAALYDTVHTSVMIIFIIITAFIFGHFLAITRLPSELSSWVSALPLPRHAILAAILFVYIPLGMFMDALAMIVLTLPIFFPISQTLGFDPIWFGVLTVVLIELGLVTPPVGLNCFVVSRVANVPLSTVFRGIVPFALLYIPLLIILVVFPQISLFIPKLMR